VSTELTHTCSRCRGYKLDTNYALCPVCDVKWKEIKNPLFLCLCQYGHSRSVCLARVLHSKKQQAIAAGVGTCGEWIAPLCRRADMILILETSFKKHVPGVEQWKVVDFHVGPDRWVNPYNQELNAILKAMVEQKLKL